MSELEEASLANIRIAGRRRSSVEKITQSLSMKKLTGDRRSHLMPTGGAGVFGEGDEGDKSYWRENTVAREAPPSHRKKSMHPGAAANRPSPVYIPRHSGGRKTASTEPRNSKGSAPAPAPARFARTNTTSLPDTGTLPAPRPSTLAAAMQRDLEAPPRQSFTPSGPLAPPPCHASTQSQPSAVPPCQASTLSAASPRGRSGSGAIPSPRTDDEFQTQIVTSARLSIIEAPGEISTRQYF